MSSTPSDSKWPRLLSLTVHEFRSPMTVVAGYIRMLLKDRAGALTEQQRRMLQEAEKSCGRLAGLVAEMSELSNLEAGTASFNRSPTDLRVLLGDAVAELPELADRPVDIELATGEGPAMIDADAARLKTALTSLLHALRRELVTSTRLSIHERAGEYNGGRASWIAIGDGEHVEDLHGAPRDSLVAFDEWRGGCGLSLTLARRVIDAHGGAIWSPGEGTKSAAVIVLPVM